MNAATVNLLLSGALVTGYAVAATFFLRFWSETRDRLFGAFALAFALLAVQRLALALTTQVDENAVLLYGIRLAAFVILLYAIIDKNRSS